MVVRVVRLGSVTASSGAIVAHRRGEAGRKTLLTVEDLYLFDGPRSVALAPDGKSIVYVRHFLD